MFSNNLSIATRLQSIPSDGCLLMVMKLTKHQATTGKYLYHTVKNFKYFYYLVQANDNSRENSICFSVDGGQSICLRKESCAAMLFL